MMVAVRFKDPTFFSNWIKAMLYRMSFWKYRLIFRYIRYVFRALFAPQFEALGFKGMKIVLRGKISVAGNARTRTLVLAVGNTSHAEMNNRILSSFTNVHSSTGVMGFRLSFFFLNKTINNVRRSIFP
jgi:ribosomal protein S3